MYCDLCSKYSGYACTFNYRVTDETFMLYDWSVGRCSGQPSWHICHLMMVRWPWSYYDLWRTEPGHIQIIITHHLLIRFIYRSLTLNPLTAPVRIAANVLSNRIGWKWETQDWIRCVTCPPGLASPYEASFGKVIFVQVMILLAVKFWDV